MIAPRYFAGPQVGGFVFAILALVLARPVALMIALAGSPLSWRERVTVGWFGPKGFASVVYGFLLLKPDTRRSISLSSDRSRDRSFDDRAFVYGRSGRALVRRPSCAKSRAAGQRLIARGLVELSFGAAFRRLTLHKQIEPIDLLPHLRSTRSHSRAGMMRGIRSKGKIRSVPWWSL